MEHIILQRQKRSPWELEIYRLKRSNERADKINKALTFVIRCLGFSAAVGFIAKFLG